MWSGTSSRTSPTTAAGNYALLIDADRLLRAIVVRAPEPWSAVAPEDVTVRSFSGRLVILPVTVDTEALPIEATEAGLRKLYMESPLAAVRDPSDLIRAYAEERGWTGEPQLPVGTVMFMGAIGAIDGIRPSPRFEMELEDPVRNRVLRHAYDVRVLPIVA